MKVVFRNAVLLSFLLLVLSACGLKTEEKMIGAWKTYVDEEFQGYMEITEHAIIMRDSFDGEPTTADYRITSSGKGIFLIELAEPGTGYFEFFLEGRLSNRNEIQVFSIMGDSDSEMYFRRVRNIQKDIADEKERYEMEEIEREIAEEEAEEERKREEEQAEQEAREKELEEAREKQMAEEKKKQEAKENARAALPEKTLLHNEGKKAQYVARAEAIFNQIVDEQMRVSPDAQDIELAFYSQYYDEWDDLLNEMWADLKKSLPKNVSVKLTTPSN